LEIEIENYKEELFFGEIYEITIILKNVGKEEIKSINFLF